MPITAARQRREMLPKSVANGSSADRRRSRGRVRGMPPPRPRSHGRPGGRPRRAAHRPRGFWHDAARRRRVTTSSSASAKRRNVALENEPCAFLDVTVELETLEHDVVGHLSGRELECSACGPKRRLVGSCRASAAPDTMACARRIQRDSRDGVDELGMRVEGGVDAIPEPASAVSALPPPHAIVPGRVDLVCGAADDDTEPASSSRRLASASARPPTRRRLARGRSSAPARYGRSAGRPAPRRRGRRSRRCGPGRRPSRSPGRRSPCPRAPARPRARRRRGPRRGARALELLVPELGMVVDEADRHRGCGGLRRQPRRGHVSESITRAPPGTSLDEYAHELGLVLGGAGGVVHRCRILGCTGAGLRTTPGSISPHRHPCEQRLGRGGAYRPGTDRPDGDARLRHDAALDAPRTRPSRSAARGTRTSRAPRRRPPRAPGRGPRQHALPRVSAVWYGPATNARIGAPPRPPRLRV